MEQTGVVDREQIDAWRAKLERDPPSFARDLAHGLLLEFERLGAADATNRQVSATWQAAIIEAQLATSVPTCIICRDAALQQVAENLRTTETQRHATLAKLLAGF